MGTMIEGKMLRNTERGPGVFRVGAVSLIGDAMRATKNALRRGLTALMPLPTPWANENGAQREGRMRPGCVGPVAGDGTSQQGAGFASSVRIPAGVTWRNARAGA